MITTRRGFGFMAAVGLLSSAYGLSAALAQDTDTAVPDGSIVVLVRHADKKKTDSGQQDKDVGLSEEGVTRREDLWEALQRVGISAVVTTTIKRTIETAEPWTKAPGVDVFSVEEGKVKEKVAEQLKSHAAVLVIGHSTTIPGLVRDYDGPDVETDGYDDLFIIVGAKGKNRFIHGLYGVPSPCRPSTSPPICKTDPQ